MSSGKLLDSPAAHKLVELLKALRSKIEEFKSIDAQFEDWEDGTKRQQTAFLAAKAACDELRPDLYNAVRSFVEDELVRELWKERNAWKQRFIDQNSWWVKEHEAEEFFFRSRQSLFYEALDRRIRMAIPIYTCDIEALEPWANVWLGLAEKFDGGAMFCADEQWHKEMNVAAPASSPEESKGKANHT